MSGITQAEISNLTQSGGTRSRYILQRRPRLLAGLRVLPAAMLLVGAVALAPDASATSCQPANVAISGGTVSNDTTVRLSADGGVAISDANGGDDNIAVGGNGGAFGDGGNAAAGNGGLAVSEANGGMIDLDDVNSGNNRGNTIAVSGGGGCGYGPSLGNVAISGGTVTNDTNIRLSADGGTAVSNANGGDDNIAVGGNGGAFGDGGNAAAGNGGLAIADANGGAITVGDINSGNNRGNTIQVRRGSGWGSRIGNVRINGGTVSNRTNLAISANGGVAVSNANGGDDNVAVAGNGGAFGDGGAAAAGNGGVAVASANGGAVTVGDINSGGNSGNTIVVEGTYGGNVAVDGGTVSNETTIDISADGGTAVATANGGDDNIAVGGTGGDFGDGGDAAAGNGGVAVSEANGGSVSIGDINSGGNSGNTIIVE